MQIKKRRPRVRPVSTEEQSTLESKLLVERDTLIANNPDLRMIPKSVICPISVIKELCYRRKSISSLEDIRSFAGVRPELHLAFLKTIVGESPLEKRSRF